MKTFFSHIRTLFSKKKAEKRDFSEFFLHASPKEKIEFFGEIAQRANEEQQELYVKSGFHAVGEVT